MPHDLAQEPPRRPASNNSADSLLPRSGRATLQLWTIAEAVEHLLAVRRVEKRRQVPKDPLISVNLVAVVTDVAVSHRRPGGDPHLSIWIRDPSISPNDTCAYVSYWGSKAEDHANAREPTIVGDVILFRGLALRHHYALDHSNNADEVRVLHEFRHSWLASHSGPSWERLAHVDSSGCADRVSPDTSTMFPELVLLLRWCKDTLADAPLRPLPGPDITAPCHQRTILEVHASIGAVSNVVANVEELQHQRPNSARLKRPRWSRDRSNHELHVFATLSDGSHSITFFHADGRFRAALEDALAQARPVRLNRVRSQRHRDLLHQLAPDSASADAVWLVPTRDTTVHLESEGDAPAMPKSTAQSWSASLTRGDAGSQSRPASLVEAHVGSVTVGTLTISRDSLFRNAALMVDALTSDDSMDTSVPVSMVLIVGDTGVGNDSEHIPVEGDLSAVRKLCGGIASVDLSSDDQLNLLATSMLTAAFQERIRFRWILEGACDGVRPHRLVGVSLPRM